MKDIETYRTILKREAVLDYTRAIVDAMANNIFKAEYIDDMSKALVSQLSDIDNADFQENYNPDHGKEQGAPF